MSTRPKAQKADGFAWSEVLATLARVRLAIEGPVEDWTPNQADISVNFYVREYAPPFLRPLTAQLVPLF
jgi:hypothetical protein